MWIIPKNFQQSSVFAQDMVGSKEDLTLLGSSIESSVMWRSKPTPLRIWSRKWNQVSWLPHLFGRTLKPSRHTYFETELQSSLAVIHASRLAKQESEKEQTTLDTCGYTSDNTFKPSDQNELFSRMSKDTFRLDCPQSSAIWKQMVTEQRLDYSARKKLAHHTEESACSSWATPNTMDHLPQRSAEATFKMATTTRKGRTKPSNLREQVNPEAMKIYKQVNWPTPAARDWKGPRGKAAQERKGNPSDTLPNIMQNMYTDSLQDQTKNSTNGSTAGLNPDWVESLMGIPTGWTDLDCWGME